MPLSGPLDSFWLLACVSIRPTLPQ
jgi:hypothetical protein